MNDFPGHDLAFPQHPGTGNCENWRHGMTLRDYFAAKAMQSVSADVHAVSYHVRHGQHDEAGEHAEFIAQSAYVMADAMLKARAK